MSDLDKKIETFTSLLKAQHFVKTAKKELKPVVADILSSPTDEHGVLVNRTRTELKGVMCEDVLMCIKTNYPRYFEDYVYYIGAMEYALDDLYDHVSGVHPIIGTASRQVTDTITYSVHYLNELIVDLMLLEIGSDVGNNEIKKTHDRMFDFARQFMRSVVQMEHFRSRRKKPWITENLKT